MKTLLDKLKADLELAAECVRQNDQPGVEIPWLVDDKFSFEKVMATTRALIKAIETIELVNFQHGHYCTEIKIHSIFDEAMAEIEKELKEN